MVNIYNSYGQRLYCENCQTSNMTIDVAYYISGIYIMKITSQHQTIVKKIIKE